ncbi:3-deoxy-D-manno-octulosonic acid transferase [Pseudorhodoferax sp. Leaf274]|uniref:3-deoxy-D-manno-octulosonic acid transferase n=1 Tax=Pseudorhodoferax sp. Leaf274 TaxID=1736318 RepID=UPI00070287FE|nr:glycosyltransferase N-terminal domain-containing protein [Pseudorhodoferax sp. Leaf274]KQP35511.1 3-deoxy-D-manno-octulosonic acid transferase [Pseudorhodoferax sp. Leaf274]
MLLRFYGWLTWLAQPLLRRKLARRAAAEPGYGQWTEERFGRYTRPASSGWVWVHAVSLGETRAAAVLVAALRERLPGMRLLLTHGTATGRAEGARLLRDGDLQAWQPWDTPGATARFLAQFRPQVGILMETEIWPWLIENCRRAGVPVVLANARLSEKSLQGAQRVPLLPPAYAALAAAYAQTEDDAARLRQAGARVAGVFGNLKFDAAPDAAQLAQGRQWRSAAGKPVVLFASSREGEEAALLALLQADAAAAGAVQWLIVPRHPQRFDAVADLVRTHGFAVARRSGWGDAPPAGSGAIWLGDSLGEMALYYGLAEMALLGGSFEPLGGQNLIEAAACGCPVLMGPHTFNFAEAAALAEQAGAALRVADLRDAVGQAQRLARDLPLREKAAQAALGFAAAHRGAAARTADAITSLLGLGLRP